jgi:hypothetical protein
MPRCLIPSVISLIEYGMTVGLELSRLAKSCSDAARDLGLAKLRRICYGRCGSPADSPDWRQTVRTGGRKHE